MSPRGRESGPSREAGFSIRARLAVMLALFALLPVLFVTYLASKRIAGSLELMKSPGVAMTLDDALTVSKTSLTKLEDALHTTCIDAAADPVLAQVVAGGRPGEMRRGLESLVRRSLLNYGALYTKSKDAGWSLTAEATGGGDVPAGREASAAQSSDAGEDRGSSHQGGTAEDQGAVPDPAGVGASPSPGFPEPELPRPLAPGLYYDSGGWLLDAVGVESPAEGTDALLVLGYYMGADFFGRIQSVSRGVGFYRRLDILKGLYVGSIWIWATGLLLAVGTATLITARLAARGLSGPLVELADGMRRVARGEESVLVRPKGSRETRFLAHTFNVMVGELAEYKKDLARAERAAAWQDIARVVAHEIRNPLTPIQFAIRRIRDRLGLLPESERGPFRESLDSILGEVDTLKTLASNFSQYAKLPDPSPAPEDLNRLVTEAVDLFGAKKSVTFELRLDGLLPPAHVDARLMRMVLNNLLKNSVEAMPGGGTVGVSTAVERGPEGDWAFLEVADTGAGMDPDTLARATDAYFSTKGKGSGLGLAVVHRIVSQHAGRLDIASRPGEGTRVSIRLPLAGGRSGGAGELLHEV